MSNLVICAFTTQVRSIDEEARTMEFVASTESVDRYGDIIRTDGWKLDNFSHRHQDPPIGNSLKIWTETTPAPALVNVVQFAPKDVYPFASTMFKLYQGGFMSAVSVVFLPLSEPKRRFSEADG